MWAHQPAVRLTANVGVNISGGVGNGCAARRSDPGRERRRIEPVVECEDQILLDGPRCDRGRSLTGHFVQVGRCMAERRVWFDRLQPDFEPVQRSEDRRHQRSEPECLRATLVVVDVDHGVEARGNAQDRSELAQCGGAGRSTSSINIDSVNIDFISEVLHSGGVSSYIGASEAARLLGVSNATLYAYVSRGRIERRTGADGRASLFALDDVEALAKRSRRAPVGPRPTIDVRVSSAITVLRDDGLTIRGHELSELVRTHSFEAIADLLWSGQLGSGIWPRQHARADQALFRTLPAALRPMSRLAVAAQLLGDLHPDDDAAGAARRLIQAAPDVLGAQRRTGSIATRLSSVWFRAPRPALVAAIDAALGLLADHELATSTLAVRVAASVRSSPMAAFAAGLAVVSGPLHGAASIEAHAFLDECSEHGVAETVAAYRRERRRIPGFGHKVYRGRDPRFDMLLDSVRQLGDDGLVDSVLAKVGRVIPKHPNVDLALGALTHAAGLDDRVPIFAVARIAGWAAHYDEELEAPPVRYRGIIA